MIPFPKYVRIGGHVIKIQRIAGLIKNEELFATWSDSDLTIQIDKDLAPSLQWECVFHELVEACVTSLDVADDVSHSVIQGFGLLLSQAFFSFFEEGQKGD